MADPNSLIDITFITIAKDLADDADCARWLAGGANVSQTMARITNMGNSSAVGFASDDGVVAQVPSKPYYIGNKPIDIVFNQNGCFFLQGPQSSGGSNIKAPPCYSAPGTTVANNPELKPGTAAYRALVALHELAHVLNADSGGGGFIRNDGNNSSAQAINNDMVWNHCRKTLTVELNK